MNKDFFITEENAEEYAIKISKFIQEKERS